MPDQRNLILAIVLSVTIIVAFQYFYELPRIKETQRSQPVQTESTELGQPSVGQDRSAESRPTPGEAALAPRAPGAAAVAPARGDPGRRPGQQRSGHDRQWPCAGLARLDRRPDRRSGSDRLSGQRRPRTPSDVALCSIRRVRPTPTLPSSAGSPVVRTWWCPIGTRSGRPIKDEVRPDQPVTLSWDNGEGLRFTRQIEIDDDFMFTVTQRVENTGTEAGLSLSLRLDPTLGHCRRRWASSFSTRGRSGSSAERWKRSTTTICRKTATSSCRVTAAGSASPTNTGWPPWCRTRRARSPPTSATV